MISSITWPIHSKCSISILYIWLHSYQTPLLQFKYSANRCFCQFSVHSQTQIFSIYFFFILKCYLFLFYFCFAELFIKVCSFEKKVILRGGFSTFSLGVCVFVTLFYSLCGLCFSKNQKEWRSNKAPKKYKKLYDVQQATQQTLVQGIKTE